MPPISAFQPFQAGSPQEGTITQWEDEKGFGWVKSGEKRVFVHIKEFERGQRRPKAGGGCPVWHRPGLSRRIWRVAS